MEHVTRSLQATIATKNDLSLGNLTEVASHYSDLVSSIQNRFPAGTFENFQSSLQSVITSFSDSPDSTLSFGKSNYYSRSH
jgi:hypothetical protein